uniref:ShKT domain-containing protein n=1 Tax=Prymnesium polylepis TaxID=72548 RepID=A0A7S4JIX9_9EUKA
MLSLVPLLLTLAATNECQQWADAGECERNARFMWDTCLHECRRRHEDTSVLCEGHVADGWCVSQPAAMMDRCPGKCFSGVKLLRTGEPLSCSVWAQQGECSAENSAWMRHTCPAACNQRDLPTRPASTSTVDASTCNQWAQRGYCEQHEVLAHEACAAACYRREVGLPPEEEEVSDSDAGAAAAMTGADANTPEEEVLDREL